VSLLAGIGIGSSTATPAAALASPAHAAVGVPHLKHVFVIMLENHSYNDIMNEQDVPYLHYLARTYGFATRYYGISNASSPNRIGILSGTTARRQLPNQPGHNLPYRNIVDQLTAHRLTWGAYYQHSRFSTAAHPTYSYQKGASTFLRFKDIADNPSRVAHLQPLRRLTAALRTSKVPNFVWIAPNTLNNMEGGFRAPGQFSFQGAGPGGAGASDQALERASNNFLRTWIPRIMHSRVWHQGQSAIFVQFDETSYDASNPTDGFWLSHRGVAGSPVVPAGTLLSGNAAFPFPGGVDGGGHAVAIVITNTARHVVSTAPYNEYSILRTIEAGFGLPYLGNAGAPHVHSMAMFFRPQAHPPAVPALTRGRHVLSGAYQVALAHTPVTAAAPPASSTSAGATITASSDPYLLEFTRHQAAATVSVTERAAGTVTHDLTFSLHCAPGVHFALHSTPVGTTRVSNPSDTATQLAPASVAARTVTFPVEAVSKVPSDLIVTGLLLDVPYGTPAGPVEVAVSSNGTPLGTLTVATVGRPRTSRMPAMLAPIVSAGQVRFPFVVAGGRRQRYVLTISGAAPNAPASLRTSNTEFVATTSSTGPVVSLREALLTPQAGKQYWATVRAVASGRRSRPVTFAADGA
jgi:hypothetical protein